MSKPLPEFPLPSEALRPHVLDLDTLPPRIACMVQALLRHQHILCAYDSLCIIFDCKGDRVNPRLEKVPLNSALDKKGQVL